MQRVYVCPSKEYAKIVASQVVFGYRTETDDIMKTVRFSAQKRHVRLCIVLCVSTYNIAKK